MYSFRYHLVTICAIFVALALGLLVGAAIASSSLVRSTSDDMVESMMSRYETLVDENARLGQELESNSALAADLTGYWSQERLDGRTVVLMLGNTLDDRSLQTDITDSINQAGGSVVNVTVLRPDFGLDDEALSTALEEIVAEVPGEPYTETLANRLEEEWSYSYTTSSTEPTQEDFDLPYHSYTQITDELSAIENAGGERTTEEDAQSGRAPTEDITPTTEDEAPTLTADGGLQPQTAFQKLFFDQYPLTRALLTFGIISINADYSLLAEHVDPSPPSDQQAAYHIATVWQLPYDVNGVISGLAQQEDEAQAQAEVGLQVTLRFQEAGTSYDLTYPIWLRASIPKSSSGDVPLPNYYTLLIQPSYLTDSMDIIASENGLSCVTHPESVSGRYSVIALLSGAQAGIYGEDRSSESSFAPLPEDTSGRAAFR